MRTHTSTTQARAGGIGSLNCRIVPAGILALSLAVVFLGATASNASASRYLAPWWCPPLPTAPITAEHPSLVFPDCVIDGPDFDFGDRQVGTTSPAQRFVLGISNNGITPRISVSGDYAQTNDCPPTLSAPPGQVHGCIITVTFTPTSKGHKQGTLRTELVSGGPHEPRVLTVKLTGDGVTTPTPPALPLMLSADVPDQPFFPGPANPTRTLPKKVPIDAITNNNATLVAQPRETTREQARQEGQGRSQDQVQRDR